MYFSMYVRIVCFLLGGVNLPNFQKQGSLAGPQLLERDSWEREDHFF